jgi:aldose 1-epimerase
MAYRVGVETVAGRPVYHLRDESSGSSASVLPSVGFNLFDLQLPVAGEIRPIVAAGDRWPEDPEIPSRHGIPILFPFPNRIRDARFEYGGRAFDLIANKGPNAIHGFALEAPWEVVAHEATDAGARIVGRFQISRNAPEDRPRWPSDAAIELSYTLAGRRLTLEATVTNPGPSDLPWGFGIHPYYHLPFRPDGDAAKTRVVLPASRYWVLEDTLPTGEVRPVDPARDFRLGKPMAGLEADDILTGLEFEGARCTCRLIDENLGAEFRLSFGREFRELVVFTPPFYPGGVVAVEPYTQTTDAIHLQARGVDAGLRVLQPGGSDRLAITLETADLE